MEVLCLVGRLQLYQNNISLQLFLMKRLMVWIRETHHIYEI